MPLEQYEPEQTGVVTKAFLRAGRYFDMSHAMLSRIIRTSESTMSRIAAGSRMISPDQCELAILLLRVFRSLDSLFGGNIEQSRLWLHSENRHLGGRPVDLIQTVQGLVHVSDYLDAMRGHG